MMSAKINSTQISGHTLLGESTFVNMFVTTLTVDTLEDENDGNLSPGDVSLREAIAFINDGGTITFDPDLMGSIILDPSLGSLVVNKSLTIDGPGAEVITVSGDTQIPVFIINDDKPTSSAVTINSLQISDGSGSEGGGIQNVEVLVLNDSTISNNVGSGIRNENILAVNNSLISNNNASGGGGINNTASGTATIVQTTLSGNNAIFAGGGILSAGTLTIADSVIEANQLSLRFAAEFGGGGIGIFSGNATITDSIIRSNFSNGEGGGIIIDEGTLTIASTLITDNRAQRGGGILANAQVLISDSTIANNNSGKDAGLDPFSQEPFDGAGGGGLSFRGDAPQTIINSTISGNEGGGLQINESATNVSLANSTVTNNTADFEGSGVLSLGNITVENSIIAANSNNSDVSSSFTSVGYNLIGNGDGSSGFGAVGDQVGTGDTPIDPRLSPLADNGGPTITHALQPSSPAIDAGNPTFTPPPNTDQRGEARVADGNGDGTARLDIGAFEVPSASPVTDGLDIGFYDTDTDTLVIQIEDGAAIPASVLRDRNLTIAAVVPQGSLFANQVESMRLDLNAGQFTKAEDAEPYALFGDNRGDFNRGDLVLEEANTLTIDLFNQDGLRGDRLGTVARNFTIVNDPISPAGLNVGIYDAKTDQLIAPLSDGAVIPASVLADRDLTIVAVVPDDSIFSNPVESVFLNLNRGQFTKTENFEPYALFGDSRGNFNGGGLELQTSNTITFDLYSKDALNGALIETIRVDFAIA